MAHELEIPANDAARMMYAGQAPWHGLGTHVEKEVHADAAMKLAALDGWNMQLVMNACANPSRNRLRKNSRTA